MASANVTGFEVEAGENPSGLAAKTLSNGREVSTVAAGLPSTSPR